MYLKISRHILLELKENEVLIRKDVLVLQELWVFKFY